MKQIFRWLLLAALLALGVWLWTVCFPSPEKVIRRRLLNLARTVSSVPGEGDLARLAAANSVAGYFSNHVELKLTVPELSQRDSLDREEIVQLVVLARSRAGGLKVTFPDIKVTVAPDRQSAAADVTVQANVAGERVPQLQEMKFTLRRMDGQWLIIRVETVQTLSRIRPVFSRHFKLCTAGESFHS